MNRQYPIGDYWDEPVIAVMKDCVAKKLSTGVIAKILTEKFLRSYTRNAVIGKCRRMGILLSYKPEAIAVSPQSKKFIWNTKSVKMLTDLVRQGFNSPVIADQMSDHYGIKLTRNQIIGKAYRLGLFLERNRHVKVREPEADPVEIIEQSFPESNEIVQNKRTWGRSSFVNPEAIGVTFMDLQSKHCRYPIGDTRDNSLLFCGAPRIDLSVPYCSVCYKLAYVPTTYKKRSGEAGNVSSN